MLNALGSIPNTTKTNKKHRKSETHIEGSRELVSMFKQELTFRSGFK
jgi:hypothetical protein